MTVLLFMSLRLRISREILEGVYQGARERRWNVQQFETVPPPDELRKVIDFWKPAGCLLYAEGARDPIPTSITQRIPLVRLADRRTNRNTVNQDVRRTVRLAIDELLQAGARSLAYIGPRLEAPWNRERRTEFLAESRRRGLKARAFAFDPTGTDERPIKDFLLTLPPPAGVLIAADPYASRVIHAANHAGIRIPSDIAFVSVDNDKLVCDNLNPTLSSVCIDFRSAGYRMIELLDEILRSGTHVPRSGIYEPSGIHRRDSTRVMRTHPLVDKAIAFIRREALSPIGVDDVAAAVGLTRRSVERLFATHADMSIASTIRSARIEHAKTALAESDTPIEFIADTCGFRSAAHLKTVFRQATGQTMRVYRQSVRKTPYRVGDNHLHPVFRARSSSASVTAPYV